MAGNLKGNIMVVELKRNLDNQDIKNKLNNGYKEMTLEEYIVNNNLTDQEEKDLINKLFAINIHKMISKETYDSSVEVIDDYHNDTRLKNMNAIVFLSLKTKGRGERGFRQLSKEEFAELTHMCLDSNTPFGFDSCGAHKFISAIEGFEDEKRKALEMSAEPCESSLFSTYIDTFGLFHPCSFSPDTEVWGSEGLDVVNCDDFIKDIWNHERTKAFREILLAGHRNCPLYRI